MFDLAYFAGSKQALRQRQRPPATTRQDTDQWPKGWRTTEGDRTHRQGCHVQVIVGCQNFFRVGYAQTGVHTADGNTVKQEQEGQEKQAGVRSCGAD